MKRSHQTFAVLLIAVAVFAACGIVKTDKVTRGHNLVSSDVSSIVNGSTTEREVLKMFGPPTKVRDTAEGQELLYEYAQSGGPRWDLLVKVGGSSHTKSLLVWLDKNGVVSDYAFKAT
jgi:outer membrane protein assembly factor BamE (lipoprotein component of BamABCDE complex)